MSKQRSKRPSLSSPVVQRRLNARAVADFWHERRVSDEPEQSRPDMTPTVQAALVTPGAFWQNVWRAFLNRAEVRYPKPHALRHTFASLLIQQDESLAYVRHQMGHHSIKITVDIYGHLVPGANKAAVDKLDDAPVLHLYATEAMAR